MKAPRRKPEPIQAPEPSQDRRPLARVYTPEIIAKRAVARRPTTPGHRVKYDLTLFLPPELAEYLVARAIREGRNVPALVAEILAAERQRHT